MGIIVNDYGVSGGGGGGASNSFTIIQPDSGTSPTADNATDTLTLTNADGTIGISGNSTTDTITFSINNSSITYAKIQDISTTNTILGRYSSGAGITQEITLGSNAEFTSNTLNFARDKKLACVCATTANLAVTASGSGPGKTLTATSNGAFSVDGITPAVNSRILVKNQSTGADRGIYVLTTAGDASNPYVLTRATDFDGSAAGQVREGDTVLVSRGTISKGVTYFVSTTGTITVDTTSITFEANGVGDIIISGNSNRPAIWDSTGALTSDSSFQYSVSNNSLGIGASSSSTSRISIAYNVSDSATSYNGGLNSSTHTLTADNANGIRGWTTSMTLAHSTFNATAAIATPALEGMRSTVTVSSGSAPGVVTAISAFNGLARNQGGGTLTNCITYQIQTATNTGGGTIDNNYGLYIAAQNQGTFIAGIYSLIASGTGRYGFYLEGTADNVSKGKITHLQTASSGNTVVNGLELTNDTTASSGNQMYSGALYWKGNGWKTNSGGASTTCEFRSYILPVQGTTSSECTLTFEANQNGAGWVNVLQLRNNTSAPQLLAEFASTALPSYSYRVDPDTGIRRSGVNAQSFICGGTEIAGVDVNGLCVGTLGINNANFGVHPTTTTKHGGVWRSRNSISVDYFNFQNDSATQEASLFRTSGTSGDWKWRMTGGTAALPSYSFYSDTDTGMYSQAANAIGFSVNGAEAFRVSAAATRIVNDASNYLDITVSGTGLVNLDATGSGAAFFFKDHIYMEDAKDFSFSGTTGTKIGQGTSEKLAFWGTTPIVQPTTAVAAATFVANTSLIANDTATFDGYTIGQVVKALRNAGLLA